MTDQQRRQRAAMKHGLSGCKVGHQGLFRPENKPYPSSLETLPPRPTFLGQS